MTSQEAREFSCTLKLYESRVRIERDGSVFEGVVYEMGLNGETESIWLHGCDTPFSLRGQVTAKVVTA